MITGRKTQRFEPTSKNMAWSKTDRLFLFYCSYISASTPVETNYQLINWKRHSKIKIIWSWTYDVSCFHHLLLQNIEANNWKRQNPIADRRDIFIQTVIVCNCFSYVIILEGKCMHYAVIRISNVVISSFCKRTLTIKAWNESLEYGLLRGEWIISMLYASF